MTNLEVLESKVVELEILFTEEFYKGLEDFNGDLVTKLGDELLAAKEELKVAQLQAEKVNVETKKYNIMTIEEIMNALSEGIYIQEYSEISLTLSGGFGVDHDLSITIQDNGSINCETYNLHAIEHFQTNEWANFKNVKTLKGLKGYMKRFGYDLTV